MQYAAALQSVKYQNTNTDNPNTGNRTVTWVVNDGDANSTGVPMSMATASLICWSQTPQVLTSRC